MTSIQSSTPEGASGSDGIAQGVVDLADPTQKQAARPALMLDARDETLARELAIKQIERRRRFWWSTAVAGLAMVLLVVVWATSEYHNAGGWPTDGFSQSSSIPHVWNIWIVYPFVAWVLGTVGHAWYVFGRRPITESEIRREMDRQAAGPRPEGRRPS